jgi:hypothetical protein
MIDAFLFQGACRSSTVSEPNLGRWSLHRANLQQIALIGIITTQKSVRRYSTATSHQKIEASMQCYVSGLPKDQMPPTGSH